MTYRYNSITAQNVRWIALQSIKERRIPLTAKRIHWYCKWLGLRIHYSYVCHILTDMVLAGDLVYVKEGRQRLYKRRF